MDRLDQEVHSEGGHIYEGVVILRGGQCLIVGTNLRSKLVWTGWSEVKVNVCACGREVM